MSLMLNVVGYLLPNGKSLFPEFNPPALPITGKWGKVYQVMTWPFRENAAESSAQKCREAFEAIRCDLGALETRGNTKKIDARWKQSFKEDITSLKERLRELEQNQFPELLRQHTLKGLVKEKVRSTLYYTCSTTAALAALALLVTYVYSNQK